MGKQRVERLLKTKASAILEVLKLKRRQQKQIRGWLGDIKTHRLELPATIAYLESYLYKLRQLYEGIDTRETSLQEQLKRITKEINDMEKQLLHKNAVASLRVQLEALEAAIHKEEVSRGRASRNS